MNNNNKFIAGFCVSLVLSGIPAGFAVHYYNEYTTLQNSEKVQDNEGLVSTIDSLRNSLVEITAINESFKATITNLETENKANKALVADLQIQLETLIAKKQELENQSVVDKENIANLENQIADKTSQIASLNATIAENNSRIATLTTEKENLSARVSELESQVAQLEADNEDSVLQIAILETEMQNLQIEIDRLYALMQDYEDIKNETYTVNFYVGNVIVHSDAIKRGSKLEELPQSTDLYRIDGWKTVDGISVDPLSCDITENVNFYADYVDKFAVTFIDGENLVATNVVASDENITFATAPTKEGWTFDGWYEDGVKVEDSNIKPTKNTTYKAQYYKWETCVEATVCIDEPADLSTTNIVFDRTKIGTVTYSSNYSNSLDLSNDIANGLVRVRGVVAGRYDGYYQEAEYVIENAGKTGTVNITLWDHDFTITYVYGSSDDYDVVSHYSGFYKFYVFTDTYKIDAWCDGEGGVEGYNQYIERYVTLYDL